MFNAIRMISSTALGLTTLSTFVGLPSLLYLGKSSILAVSSTAGFRPVFFSSSQDEGSLEVISAELVSSEDSEELFNLSGVFKGLEDSKRCNIILQIEY